MTSVSLDKADVEEEMDEAVEARLDEVVEEGAVEEAGVTAATGGKGCVVEGCGSATTVGRVGRLSRPKGTRSSP